MTFGSYPDVPLSLARERHAAVRKLLATGTDPMAERKAEKAAVENSFQSIGLAWWQHWQEGKSPRHVEYVKRRMEADIFPQIGARPIAAIEAPELVTMTKTIEKRGHKEYQQFLQELRKADPEAFAPQPTGPSKAKTDY